MLRRITWVATAVMLLPTAPAALASSPAPSVALGPADAASASGAAAATPTDWRNPTRSVRRDPHRVVASVDSGETAEIVTITAHRGKPELQTVAVRGPRRAAAAVAAAQRNEDLLYVGVSEPVKLIDPAGATAAASNDPRRSELWAFDRMDVESTWNHSTGTGVTVAVLDTGIAEHPDLPDTIVDVPSPLGGSSRADGHGHGTHVAGTIAAVADNGVGVAGVAPDVQLMAVKVLSDSGSGSSVSVANGILAAVDAGADVINMSLGGGSPGSYQTVIDYALTRGVSVVAAAGNSRRSGSPTSYPAALVGVTAVAATDRYSQYGWFSNSGNYVDLAAPGVDVLSTVPGGRYAAWNGTSMATPHVAAAVALVRQVGAANPEELLMQTAEDLGQPGHDPDFGAGLIDPLLAVRTAAQSAPPGAGRPDAPTGLSASSANSGASTIAWDPPADDGGDPVLRYRVRGFRDDDPDVRVACSAAAPQTQCSIANMPAGNYTFTVTAHNRVGSSPAADTVSEGVSVPPDQAGGTPATSALFPLGTAVLEWIQDGDDVDMWRIAVPRDATKVDVRLDQLPHDYDLALLDSSGQPLKDWTGAELISDQSGRNSETLSVRLNAGTYYASVYTYSSFSVEQPYRLLVTAAEPPQPTSSAQPEAVESGPPPAAAPVAAPESGPAPAAEKQAPPSRPKVTTARVTRKGKVVLSWRSAGAGVRYTVQTRGAKGAKASAPSGRRWAKVATTSRNRWRGRIAGTRAARSRTLALRVVPRNAAGRGTPSRAVRIRLR